MKVTLTAAVRKVPDKRLVFASGRWKDLDLQVCVHGEKLRWRCDECEEFFEKRRLKRKPRKWPKKKW